MGMIGRWIDQKCASEPDVMRQVLNRKFGNLGNYVEDDGCAGCLIGSYYLARGEAHIAKGIHNEFDTTSPHFANAELGMSVAHLRYHWHGGDRRPEREIVRAIKQRIRKSLGIAPENRPASIRVASRETVVEVV